MRRAGAALGAMLFVLLTAGPLGAEPAPRLAVVDGVRVGVSSSVARDVVTSLARAIEDVFVLEVVTAQGEPGEETGDACPSSKACLTAIAERADADQVLYLIVIQVDGALRIEPTWFDADTGDREKAEPLLISESDDLLRRFRHDAPELLPRARLRPKPVREPKPEPDPEPRPGPVEEPREPERRGSPGLRRAGLWTAGAGAAVGAAALVLGLRARWEANSLEESFAGGGAWTPRAADRERSFRRNRTLAIVGGGVAATAVTAGLLMWWLGGDGEEEGRSATMVAAPFEDGAAAVFEMPF